MIGRQITAGLISSNPITAYKLGQAATGFDPRMLFAGGENGAWYDISDISTLYQDTAGNTQVTAIGQTVKRIRDKSGNNLHVTNSTGWVLAQDSLGKNYLTADAASAFTASISWTGTALTLACAFNTLTTPGANEYLIGLGNTGNATAYGGLLLLNTTGQARYTASGGFGSIVATATDQGVPGDPHVTMGCSTGPTAYRDMTANAGTGLITDLSSLNVMTLGALTRSIFGNAAGGKFYGALAITRALSSSELTFVNLYMRSLFGASGMFLAVGDSHTYNTVYGLAEAQFYPRRIAAAISDRKLALNFGVSGNTTGNMIARLADITEAGCPDYAVIYGSTNDISGITTVQASPSPTTSAFTVAAGYGARYGAGALITVNGVNAEVLSVSTDRITLASPLGVAPSAGHAVELRTQDNLVKIGQAIQAIGCQRILIPGLHYYNFASGLGDTTSSQSAAGSTLRTVQQAAATALGAVYVDLYAWMRELIVAGTYTQGNDTAWHVAVGNAHLNATGEQILSDAIYASIAAAGWP